MTSNSIGKIFNFTTWGESHGKAIGCVVDGVPSNINLTEKDTDFYNLRIDIDVDDNKHIDNIIKSLRGLPEVSSVERLLH